VLDTILGRFFIKVTLQDLKIQIKWDLVFVYGAAQEEDKEMFLSELAAVCSNQKNPMLIGGDFNILRFSFEKNKEMRRNKWSSLFNAIINSHDLREIDMSGGQYTWSNNQINPTLEKLDRFLMTSDWEDLFPLTTVHKVSREASDHNPVIVDTMEGRELKKKAFRFEKSWLKEEEFLHRVERSWRQPIRACNSLEKVQIKLKKIKSDLKGWGANIRGRDKKKKHDLHLELAILEELEEQSNISLEHACRKI
jgi:hypothetical protein